MYPTKGSLQKYDHNFLNNGPIFKTQKCHKNIKNKHYMNLALCVTWKPLEDCKLTIFASLILIASK